MNAVQKVAFLVLKNINNPELIDYAKAIIIGTTGSGKTALIHLLAGDKLISSNKKFVDYELICPKTILIEYEIREDYLKTFPKVFIDHKNKIIFIEFPDYSKKKIIFKK